MSISADSARHSPLATRHSEVEAAAVVRPRTTGELLDDAWRLYFADAPALLLLSGLFLAPAFAALLLLIGLPAPSNAILSLPAPLLTLALLVLTGVGSGACQEWLRARAEGRTPSPAGCLAAAFRRGMPHAAARALALLGPMLGLGVWLSFVSATENGGGSADGGQLLWRLLLTAVACLPGLLVWPILATLPAFLASGKSRIRGDLAEHFRQTGSDTGKSGVVTLSRVALLILAVVNLHLLIGVGLWVLDGLAGLDAAFVGMQLSIDNPVYDLALFLLAWLLLAPFFEACNFLLYVDARSRHEGLDLQLRVQRVFPTAERKRVGALALLLGALWLTAAPARADENYDAVHAARLDVQRIAREAAADDPYHGLPWQNQLARTADQLGRSGVSPAWFRKEINGFAQLEKSQALRTLTDLDDRLGLLEETLPHDGGAFKAPSEDDLIKRLQQPGDHPPVVQPEQAPDRPKDQTQEDNPDDPKNRKKPDDQDGGGPHPGLIDAGGFSGCGPVVLMLAAGLALAVLAVGAVMLIAHRRKAAPAVKRPAVPARTVRRTEEPREPLPIDRPLAELWREADDLARQDKHREAVARFTWRYCPCCTAGSCCASRRRAPTASTSGKCGWRRRRRPPCTRPSRSSPPCLSANGTAIAPATRPSSAPARKLAEEVQGLAREA